VSAHLRMVRDGADAQQTARRPVEQPLLGATVHYVGAATEAFTDVEVEDLIAHRRRFGPRPHTAGPDGDALIETLDEIGLSGRGGGHFPVAAKWRAVRRTRGEAVVVANGAEGEPLSRKDAALLELRPHLVLDGLACAAEALGATDAVIWLHDGADSSRASIERALAERYSAGLVEPSMRVETGPDRYLSGESSAVVRALSGGPALPQLQRVPTACRGVDGRPTLVQNVETLARVATAARPHITGMPSTLLTVIAPGHRVVVEVDPRTRLDEAIGSVLGRTPIHAVLLGGYGGSWAAWSDVADVAVNEKDLRLRGLSLGAGIVLPLHADDCGITKSAEIIDYLAASSARQCGPCVFGLRAVADLMIDLADGSSRRRDLPRMRRFLAEIAGRGACSHPDGGVRMVSSAITTFADDVQAHLKGRCRHAGPDRGRHRHG